LKRTLRCSPSFSDGIREPTHLTFLKPFKSSLLENIERNEQTADAIAGFKNSNEIKKLKPAKELKN